MSNQSLRRSRRSAAVAGVAALAVLGLALPAAAHVTVNPDSAEQGDFTKVAFRVPNEKDDAGTTKIQIDLPVDHAVAFVSVRPVPGWKVKVHKIKLPKPIRSEGGEITEAVTNIIWSGGKIQPGQFEEFDVSMGPLPTDTDRMVFRAAQTYSNGEVVKWDQDPRAGEPEPEHPAPVLALKPKGSAAAPAAQRGVTADVVTAGKADDGTARTLGWIGLAAGLVGVALGGFALVRTRSRS